MSSLKYWVWLASVSGVSARSALDLLERFETPEKVFFAREDEYREAGVNRGDIEALSRKNIAKTNEILAICVENNWRVVTMQDAEYPDRLRNIYDPPTLLYVRGRLPVIDEEAAFAIVGTRSCTPYGVKTAEKIGYELTRYGMLVVSGLARGVDSAAARGALRAGGSVIGVIGSGLDVIYPPENGDLFDDVASAGAIITEYPPGTPAAGTNFPARNRIISGLSVGVAIVEAPRRSGALITASRALEQGRDVFALPGNIDSPSCEGSNALLKEGAFPLISAIDVAREYAPLFPDKIRNISQSRLSPLDKKMEERLVAKTMAGDKIRQAPSKKEIDNTGCVEYIDLDKILSGLEGDEHEVAKAIGVPGALVDEIIAKTGLAPQHVLSALTMLEINGIISQTGGGFFSLVN